ncbi:hypothetical protein F3Y22_tig00112344pilonHSYRG00303 [Hibiscus syriacus]|uniref:Mitochondrial import inner membrane translocase subunit TIM50 n=1 Tax=Hibiscus syriacus TaxID=106335 RepID=A0A6A2YBA9_HIBSY|nr:hypothetical protein F3Y22_tig00112344pilonHSYRG00303 [Hibiscus syriacus]
MAPKRQRQKRSLSQSSSQPSSSQPQPPSVTNDSSEEIMSFETLNFRSNMEKQRWQTSFKVRKIRPERVIDLGFLFDDKYAFSFKSTFTSWGWLEFLGVEPRYYSNLVRVFYNNASLQHEPNKTNIIGINTHVMGKDIYISPETIAEGLGVANKGDSDENAGYDFVEKLGWKRVKEVELDQEREEMDPVGHEEEQPSGDAMMEEAPVAEDVTIKTVMEYMVNFREHIDSLVSGMRSDISSLQHEVSMLRNELHVDNQAVNEDEADDEDAMMMTMKLTMMMMMMMIQTNVVLGRGLFEFMQFCVDNFVVALWSSKMRHNVDRILEKLPIFSEHFLFVWDQKKCKTYDSVTYCKDLNDVWNVCPDFNELNTLLVDDSAEKMIYNPKYNYICPHTFNAASHSNDNALEKGGNIREYLENLLKASNVPDFVRNNPFSSD